MADKAENAKHEITDLEITQTVLAIYIITADKGGTGKSFVARVIVDGLIDAKVPFILMECDIGIPDTAKLFGDASGYDIDTTEGWRDLYDDIVAAPRDRAVIITMPGGFLQRAKTHMPAFLKVLPMLPGHLGRPLRVIWVGDDKRDVLESLRNFRLATDGKTVTDFVKNEHFCPADRFQFFDSSEEKRILTGMGGKILYLPKLAYRIAQIMTNKRLKRSDMVQQTDLIDKIEYEEWWKKTVYIFRDAGYVP